MRLNELFLNRSSLFSACPASRSLPERLQCKIIELRQLHRQSMQTAPAVRQTAGRLKAQKTPLLLI
jgi:hypothetical protein